MKNRKQSLFIFALISLGIVAVAPFVGTVTIPFSTIFNFDSSTIQSNIFWRIRVPRVLIAAISGSALAIGGMVFQAMFRNALATPFTLGVSSGAAFGAALYVKIGFVFSLLGIAGQTFFAFIGALISILLVYLLSKIKNGFPVGTMLLAGVAINFFFSSFILFMQFMSDFTHSFRIIRWLMGGLEVVGYSDVYNILPFVLIGTIIIIFLSTELNLLTLGEDIAVSRGVSLSKIKNILFFATSLMVSGIISTVGPIGFVGMMVPHISRLIIGADHRYLVVLNIIFGGAFLVLCDTLSRTLIAPAEIPVGVITALLGGPFFIWLLTKNSKNYNVN